MKRLLIILSLLVAPAALAESDCTSADGNIIITARTMQAIIESQKQQAEVVADMISQRDYWYNELLSLQSCITKAAKNGFPTTTCLGAKAM